MKPNPERNWSIELLGDGENYHSKSFRGTVAAVLAAADEEESEVDWQVNRFAITALGAN